jgi:predicted enzyme related to lactoylglutathione lyase
MTNLIPTHAFLTVHDQDAALKFYTEAIGLEVRADIPLGDSVRWLTVGAPGEDLEIGLMYPSGPYSNPDDTKLAIEAVSKGLVPGLVFRTDDVEATFEKLRAYGAEVEQEPTDQPYGRDCAFRDPSGNHLRFSQLPTS